MADAVTDMIAICRRYSDADVAAFIPYLIVTFAPKLDANSRGAAKIVGALAEKIGVTDPSRSADAFREHFAKNPPNAALVEEFERYFREHLTGGLPDGAAEKLAKVVGSSSSKQPLSGARPAGTVAASPFARFQVQPKSKE